MVPLAFARSQLGDSKDPVAVMEAVQGSATRVDIFCQAGSMVVPRQSPRLVEFLGSMVHEIRRPRPGRLFHPKLWLLRFDSSDSAPCFRFLALSRNLTLDRSWDLVLRLDGSESRRRNPGNDQLVRLIHALPGMTTTEVPGERAEGIGELANQVRRVEWEHPDDVNEIHLWAFGLGRTRRPDFSGYRKLVISPFLTEGGLDVVRADTRQADLSVVARSEEFDRLGAEAFADSTTHILDPVAEYEDEPDTPDRPPALSNLHAKMFVVERDKRAHVFVGSANATEAAFGGNVEILCELVGGHTKLGVGSILDDDTGMGVVLQPYQPRGSQPENEADALKWRLEEFLRSAAEVPLAAHVSPDHEHWRIQLLSGRDLPTTSDAIEFSLGPLNRPLERYPAEPGASVRQTLGPRSGADLTAFYILTARSLTTALRPVSCVVRAELIGAPESRLDEIVAEQINTPEKFLRFLLLLLGAEPDPTDWTHEARVGAAEFGAWQASVSGVFELLTTSLASRPETIDDLAGIVGRLQKTEQGRSILPAGWDDLWEAVMAARVRLGNPA